MIDVDVHNDWTTAEVLFPYMNKNFIDYMTRGELPGPRGTFPHANRPFPHPEGFMRYDISEDGRPGAHFKIMKEKLLDRYNHDIAVLNGEEGIEAHTLAHPDYASALCQAHNDWMLDTWLTYDPRFRGSLIVAPQDPTGAAAEIRRVGDREEFVQVLVSSGSYRPYGNPVYHPIWEAAAEVGLPVAIHLGGHGGMNYNPISCGPTTYFWETHALLAQNGQTQMASLIVQGVFEKWPSLKFLIIECGVAWAAPILWRLDADWKALRKETPWVKRLPSEYFRDHIRLASQPLERPKHREHLLAVLEAIDGKHTLMFASDYPHWDFDDPNLLAIPKDWRENVFHNNALDFYGDRLKRYLAKRSADAEDMAVAAD
ncbi:MAG: amidohydrolase family protein [Chloroflexota bacterium]